MDAQTPTAAHELSSVSGLVGVDDRLRDTPAVAHLVPVLMSPLSDRVGLLATRTGVLLRNRLTLATSTVGPAAAGLTSGAEEGAQGVAKLGGVVVRQVDLVVTAVEREVERTGCLRAVEVIDEPHGRLLGHCTLPFMWRG